MTRYKVTHSNTGKVEFLNSRLEVDQALPVSPSDWALINSGKTVKIASFLGQVEVKRIRS